MFSIVPRKVLRASFDSPLELDEQDQNAPASESEFDEDDHIYKEAIPPAPKLQGAIPRTNNSHTNSVENILPFDPISTPNKTDKISAGLYMPIYTSASASPHLIHLFMVFLLFILSVHVHRSSRGTVLHLFIV